MLDSLSLSAELLPWLECALLTSSWLAALNDSRDNILHPFPSIPTIQLFQVKLRPLSITAQFHLFIKKYNVKVKNGSKCNLWINFFVVQDSCNNHPVPTSSPTEDHDPDQVRNVYTCLFFVYLSLFLLFICCCSICICPGFYLYLSLFF